MPAIPIIALATAVVGTGVSLYEGEKSNKLSQQANATQRQQADLQNVRSQRDQVRASRLALAQSQSAAENQGVGGSSSAQGGQGSIISQLSDNLSFLDQYGKLSDQASETLGKAQTANFNAHTFGDVASLGFQAFGKAPEIQKAVKGVFKSG